MKPEGTLISIIVPVYNVESYLCACVESVLNSTYQNFEVILVDDGSSDKSSVLCDQFASQDNRIKVFHQHNLGIARARNHGLAESLGDYVLFMDSDDIIHPDMLKVLVAAIKKDNYDFSMAYGKRVHEENVGKVVASCIECKRDLSGAQELTQQMCMAGLYDLKTYQYQVVWNKLYRKPSIKGIRFNDVASEDLDWNNRFFLKAKRGILIPQELYYYVQRSGSMMNQGVNIGVIERLKTALHCLKQIPKENRAFRAHSLKYIYKTFLYVRYKCSKCTVAFMSDVKAFGKQMYNETHDELATSELSLIRRISLILFYRFPILYRAYMSQLEK
jgi:glycosyltransferase involved in cell wall biosynthesis